MDLENEIWKDIEGYEGYYQISNLGMVKSLDRIIDRGGKEYKIKERVLSNYLGQTYFQVVLHKCKIKKIFSVHRLVAETFIPNPENKEQVNHIDGNKNNNCASNLEWVSKRENQLHAYAYGLQKPSQKQREIARKMCKETKSKKVAQYDKNMNLIRIWNSMTEASVKNKVNLSCITNCCRGNIKTSGVYIWRYING